MSQTYSTFANDTDRHHPPAELRVDVIADLICPFCYLGKRRLDTALRSVAGPIDVSWYPFQLNPEMPAQGMDFNAYLASRFGPAANVTNALEGLSNEGRAAGITFRFDLLTRVPSTLAAHQLMHVADIEGKNTSALAEELMAGYFERGEDIGDRDTLIRLAGKHGLNEAQTIAAIDDEAIRNIVLEREAKARTSGIVGVPGFLLNRRLLVVGAQTSETLISAFDRAMFGEGDDAMVSPAVN